MACLYKRTCLRNCGLALVLLTHAVQSWKLSLFATNHSCHVWSKTMVCFQPIKQDPAWLFIMSSLTVILWRCQKSHNESLVEMYLNIGCLHPNTTFWVVVCPPPKSLFQIMKRVLAWRKPRWHSYMENDTHTALLSFNSSSIPTIPSETFSFFCPSVSLKAGLKLKHGPSCDALNLPLALAN